MELKRTILFSLFALVLMLIVLLFTPSEPTLESYYSRGKISDLYQDSVSNKISFIDYPRCEQILLDDNREYFFTVKKVTGTPTYKSELRNWIEIGDSIIKDKNSNRFVVKKENSSTHTVVFFK